MEIEKIINNKFKNVESLISENRERFVSASPFPFIIIKDFFSEQFLDEVLSQFPNLAGEKKTTNYSNKNEGKRTF